MWLLMSQIQVLPVRKDHEDYAQEIVGRLAAVGARAEYQDVHRTVHGLGVVRCPFHLHRRVHPVLIPTKVT